MQFHELLNLYVNLGRWLNTLSQRPKLASGTLLIRVCFAILALSDPLRLLAEDRPVTVVTPSFPLSPTLTASANAVCVGTPISITATCEPGYPASFTVAPAVGSASSNVYTIGGNATAGSYTISASCSNQNGAGPTTVTSAQIGPGVMYVTQAGAGNKTGTSWSNALSGTALAGVLSTACTNTTFLVGSGLYKPTITTNQTASFSIASGVQVYGGYTVSGNTGMRPAINPLNGSPSSTTFSGDIGTSATSDNSYQVVRLKAGGNVLLDGIVITGGNSNQNGGGIYNEGGSFTLANASVSSNTANTSGGGVYSVSGTIGIQQSVLLNNVASNNSGGGVYIQNGVLTISTSRVLQNIAGTSGGAIYNLNSLATIQSSTVSENRAAYDGGAIYLSGTGNLTIGSSQLAGNSSVNSNGGAIYASSTLVATLTSCSLTENTAYMDGGVLKGSANVQLTLDNCFISGNTANNSNGGVINAGSSLTATISSCSITQNVSNNSGGCFYVSNSANLAVSNTLFANNYARQSNGGILSVGSNLIATITSSSATQNTTSQNGGGFYVSGTANLMLANSLFSQNRCMFSNGGGFYIGGSLTATIGSCQITQHAAQANGGFLYASGATSLTLDNSSISQNTINLSNGGGFYIGSTLTGKITSSTIAQNSSDREGGAVYVSGAGSLTLTTSHITQNQSRHGGGGGLYASQSLTATITSCSITQNTASANGGGVMVSGNGSLTIANSLIAQNLTENLDGSGIKIGGSLMATITSSSITQNTARNDNGGGIKMGSGGRIVLENSVVSQNKARSQGAAISMESNNSLTMTNTDVSQNMITDNGGSGGGITSGSNLTAIITNSTINDNVGSQSGGGLYMGQNSNLTLTTSSVSRNKSNNSAGGGISAGSNLMATITSSSISQNTAVYNGGGLDIGSGSSYTITNSLIGRNQVTNSYQPGGGINNGSSTTMVMTSCTVTQNTATNSGAGVYQNGGLALVHNSLFTQNQIPVGFGNGGAIGVSGGITRIASSTFVGNAAMGDPTAKGGAIFADGTNFTLTSSNISQNSAIAGGGVYVANSGPGVVPIQNVLFSRNTATKSGGAIVAEYSTINGVNLTLNGNSATQGSVITSLSNYNGPSSVSLVNSIVWGNNTAPNNFTVDGTSALTIKNSIVDPTSNPATYTNGGNNKMLDPKFIDATNNDLTLATCSPAINAGDDAATSTTTDLANQNRKVGTVDMGAYEFQSIGNIPLGFTQQPLASSVVCSGATLSMAVSVSGTPTSFVWYKNGSSLSGQTSATLSLPSATTSDAGSYSVVVADGCSSITSTAFSLTVNKAPTVSIAPSTTLIGLAQGTSLTASGATSYTWSTPSNSTVISVTPTVETAYSVSGTGENGCVGVATATVSVSCAAVAAAQASPPTVVGVLGAGNCPLSITTQATGNSFVFTGADGFVFSNVYRRVGTYPVTVSGIKQPGTFTFTAKSTNACGQTTTEVISFVVTGVGCP